MRPARPGKTIHRGVGNVAARGIFWLSLNTVASRIVAIVGQIVLAWYLGRREFGIFATGITITVFIGLVQQTGLGEILIRRSDRFRVWANAAFWMSLSLGLVAATIVCCVAPLASRAVSERELLPILIILGIGIPLNSLATVASADLQIHMRFRLIALVNTWAAAATIVLSLLLAWLGYGVYSLAIPRVAVSLVQTGALWTQARVPIRRNPQLRRWRFLIGDSSAMIIVNICYTIINQGDYATLMLLGVTEGLGVYYFAFNLAVQTIVLVTQNVGSVLLPALCRIDDGRERQLLGFVRASRAVAFIGAPLALLQVGLADPGIRALFAEKWYAAIPILQILSLGMTFSMIGGMGTIFLQAQGRFQTLMRLAIACATAVATMLAIGGVSAQVIGVALAIGIYHGLYGPIYLYIAVRFAGGGLREVTRIYSPAIPIAATGVVAGVLIARLIPAGPISNWFKIVTISSTTAVVYLPAMRLLAPDAWSEVSQQAFRMLKLPRPYAKPASESL